MTFFDHLAASLLTAIPETALLTAATALLLAGLPALTASVRSRIWTIIFFVSLLLSFASAGHAHASAGSVPLHLGPTWELSLLSLWATLVVLRAAALLRSALSLRRIRRRATPFPLAPGLQGIAQAIPVCTSDEVAAPSLAGFLHPLILLPATLAANLDAHDLRTILLHEMEHLRRRDHWTNLLQKLGLVLLPLNPALFWVERRLCLERELACDDGVLRSTPAVAYATSLTNLAERSLLKRGMLLALGAWQRQSELSRRVLRILATSGRQVQRPGQIPRLKLATGTALAIVLSLVLSLTVGLARMPQLISFTPAEPPTFAAVHTPQPAFSSQSTASMHLVRAAMPMPARIPSLQSRMRRIAHKPSTRRAARPQFLMLTAWHPTAAAPILTFAVQDGNAADGPQTLRLTYATVRVPSGWLIFQL